jgi:hypothetical protein
VFARIPISTAARDVIVGLLELETLRPALDIHLADAHEYRAMLEQRIDAVADLLASARRIGTNAEPQS